MTAKKRITQETFDEAVRENMDDFDMPREEAIKDAIEQFDMQVSIHHPARVVRNVYALTAFWSREWT